MGRRTWIKCGCGKKLHTKAKVTVCYDCGNKARKAEMKVGKRQ